MRANRPSCHRLCAFSSHFHDAKLRLPLDPAVGRCAKKGSCASCRGTPDLRKAKLAEARRRIDALRAQTGRDIMLQVDGGVKTGNIAGIARAGADTFVAGSAIFGSKDYAGTIAAMRDALKAVG